MNAPLIGVIDHGAGNLVSITQGLERAGSRARTVTEPAELEGIEGIVLPGVGVPGMAMARLVDSGLASSLARWRSPLLGICVGLQLFFESSDEDRKPCLGVEAGIVRRLQDAPLLPHIGWNDLDYPLKPGSRDPIFAGIKPQAPFYFVHSYAPVPRDRSIVIAYARYRSRFVAAIRNGSRIGVQFHPERSGTAGLRLLSNFVSETRRFRARRQAGDTSS